MVSPLLILLGPPASGKGTQAHKLVSHFVWESFSAGNTIRQRTRDDQDFATRTTKATTKYGILPVADATGSVGDVEARLREIGSQFAATT